VKSRVFFFPLNVCHFKTAQGRLFMIGVDRYVSIFLPSRTSVYISFLLCSYTYSTNQHYRHLKGENEMAKSFDVASLQSLTGKAVRVYKAGPESKRGKLIAVMEDYILLEVENEGLVYYNTDHIRSVVDDIQAVVPESNRPDDFYDRYLVGENINHVLNNLKYSLIKVDRGGPESRMGRLLGVGEDFFVLYTKEDGPLYYQTQHVKSITVETVKEKVLEEYPEYLEGNKLSEVFEKAATRWVKINRGGPESVEGILVSSMGDHIILVNNKEVYRIANFHIRNFSVMDPNAKQNQNQNQENNNNAEAAKEEKSSRSSEREKVEAVSKSSSEKKKSKSSSKEKVTASRSSQGRKRYTSTMIVKRRNRRKSASTTVRSAWRPSQSFKGMMVPKNKKK
jgi:spore coat protein B